MPTLLFLQKLISNYSHFEAAWNTHENFRQVLQENWTRGRELVFLLRNLTDNLKVWNKAVFGNIFKRKKEILARLNGIQNSPNYGCIAIFSSLWKMSFKTNSRLLCIKKNTSCTKSQVGNGLPMVTVIQSTITPKQLLEDVATRLFLLGMRRQAGDLIFNLLNYFFKNEKVNIKLK
jgi:hypothetical protein